MNIPSVWAKEAPSAIGAMLLQPGCQMEFTPVATQKGSEVGAAQCEPMVSAEGGSHAMLCSPEWPVEIWSCLKGALSIVKLAFLSATWHFLSLAQGEEAKRSLMDLSLALPLPQGADQTEALI